jgi:hypothetical protein
MGARVPSAQYGLGGLVLFWLAEEGADFSYGKRRVPQRIQFAKDLEVTKVSVMAAYHVTRLHVGPSTR